MTKTEPWNELNNVPPMFRRGISNKFTKDHRGNFQDTSINGATASRLRAEKRAARQAEAIQRQQEKVSHEMKKIEELTRYLHRQQAREADRLRNRLNYSAIVIQQACSRAMLRWRRRQQLQSTVIQRYWRGYRHRQRYLGMKQELRRLMLDHSACLITRSLRIYILYQRRKRVVVAQDKAALTIQRVVRGIIGRRQADMVVWDLLNKARRNWAAINIQKNMKCYLMRTVYLDILYLVCRIQANMRGYLIRKRLRWIASIDIDGLCKFQALYRGYALRQRRKLCFSRKRVSDSLGSEAFTTTFPAHQLLARRSLPSETTLCTSNRLGTPPLRKADSLRTRTCEDTSIGTGIKRPYWVPSGISTSTTTVRLPALTQSRKLSMSLANEGRMMQSFGNLQSIQTTPKKRFQRTIRPIRLSPVEHLPHSACSPLTLESEVPSEDWDLEYRQRREEELKAKLMYQQQQAKRRQELELQLKEERAREASERKLMEMEERRQKLEVKVQNRRARDLIKRRFCKEQRLMQQEKMKMAREERLMRLHMKVRSRKVSEEVATKKKEVEPKQSGRKWTPQEGTLLRSAGSTKSKTKLKVNSKEGKAKTRSSKKAKLHSSLLFPEVSVTAREPSNNSVHVEYGDEFEDIVDEQELVRLLC